MLPALRPQSVSGASPRVKTLQKWLNAGSEFLPFQGTPPAGASAGTR